MGVQMKYILTATLLIIGQALWADQFAEGQKAVDDGNYQLGYTLLSPLAKQNNAEAQYIIGRILAEKLIENADPKKGIIWLEKATENRHMQAAQTLGRMYLSGFGVPLDTDKGAHYLALAEEFRPEDEPEEECD